MIGATAQESNTITLFWRVKLRLALNYLRDVKRHILLHAAFGVSVLTFLLLGGFFFFNWVFGYLGMPEQEPWGAPLRRRLIGMVLMAFFSMLTFSNLIIMLTTTYISREVEFFMAQPIGRRRLFFCKLGETTIYSSWAFIILSFPFFLAWGNTNESTSWLFYPVTALLLVPYLLIPSALGALATLLLTVFFPAKKSFRLALGLAGVAIVMGMMTARYMGIGQGVSQDQTESLKPVMTFLGIGDVVWMPSTWLARAVQACLARDWADVGFWGAMLYSSAFMALQVCYWLAGPLYYRGYCASRTSGTSSRAWRVGLYQIFNTLTRPIRPSIRALITKDLTVFWRDPAQWGQLVVLFALLFFYMDRLGRTAEISRFRINIPFWQSLISLFNVGATCFVLSILSTRFFYPMLSLEGKQQWVIGLAPLARTQLVWVKYGLCWTCSLLLTLPFMLYSCVVLDAGPFVYLLSFVTVTVMSMGLTSLAIGLGAWMPNFQEDNPSRIANGLGGTINVIVSLIYIVLTIVLEAPIVWVYVNDRLPSTTLGGALVFGAPVLWMLVHVVIIIVPMRLGLRRWQSLEF